MLFCTLIVLLSLCTFDATDPSLNHVVSGKAQVANKAGLFGAYLAGFLNDVFGVAAFIWPALLAVLGAGYISVIYELMWWRWCGYFILTLCLLSAGSAWGWHIGDVRGGGMVGQMLYDVTCRYFSPGGALLILLFGVLMGLQLALGISWLGMGQRVWALVWGKWGHKLESRQGWRDFVARLAAWRARLAALFAPRKRAQDGAAPLPDIQMEPLPQAARVADGVALLDDDGPSASAAALVGGATPEAVIPEAVTPEAATPEAAILDDTTPDAEATPGATATADGLPAGLSADLEILDTLPTPAVTPDAEADAASDAACDASLRVVWEPEEVTSPPDPASVPQSAAQSAAQTTMQASPQPGPQARPAQQAQASPQVQPAKPSLFAPLLDALRPGKRPLPLPPLDLLKPEAAAGKAAQEDLQAKGKALITCLANFDIASELVRITPGPVVTMFEVRPAAGIRVNRIANLSDDLALALKALAVRIQAPIPGSDTVGVEIPNTERHIVNFRSLLESPAFRKSEGLLHMAVGKDIAGRPFTADLARMPHMLVGGATGQGKSVCLNSILLSFLYRARPDELKLLLIDPKRIEMAVYADLPHLVHPVVTEMSHAKNALDWAVHEMENRFAMLGKLHVRNLPAYNEKLKGFGAHIPPEYEGLAPLPYLVIIIDELADLMLTVGREVETSIVRLAQLARAAGIHMILATQRPSVDVVTGLIKANFPSRISFKVSSKPDSRTILDTVGAEALLGMGDMLFKHSTGQLQRLHGPFVSDEEVQAVVNHWKQLAPPSYEVDFASWGNEVDGGEGAAPGGAGDGASDPLYAEVTGFVMEQGKASISLIQRRFRIGFNRAARMVEQLERDGVIVAGEGNKGHKIAR